MRRDELIGYIPLCCDGIFVRGAGFVVEDVEIDSVVVVVYASHDVVVRRDAVDVTA